jgi:ABC-type multidrug transport system fused ATPase/permease subunit
MGDKKASVEYHGNPIVNLFREEWRNLGRLRGRFLIYMGLFTISGVVALMTPLVIGLIFNSIQDEITSDAEMRHLLFLISLILVIKVVFWIFHGIGRVMEQKTAFFVHRNYTNAKIAKVLELPVKWHKDHHSGDTIDKINKGRSAVRNFSDHYTFDLVYSVLRLVVSVIILFFFDVTIAVSAFLFSSLILIFAVKVDKHLQGKYREINRLENKASASIFDYLSNIITIITLRMKKTVRKEVDRRTMASWGDEKKSIYLSEVKWGVASIGITLMTVVLLGFRAYNDYNISGTIMIGTLYILYEYLSKMGDTFFNLANTYNGMVRMNARVHNARPIDNAFEKLKVDVRSKLPEDWNRIDLRNINFTYNIGEKKNHIHDVNISFKRGQKIAFVGESGSGKSTFLSLMRGLYEPEGGHVYCNGQPLRKGFNDLKHHITLIPQDPEIFNNTIRYNITMGIPYKKEDIGDAIKWAQFEKVGERLEKGLDTNVLEKGVSLSGGEKQRLALARGILAAKKSDIVLLDEPTSSVDSLNEMKIHDSIFREFDDKVIISSIHRLHLLEKFDYIYLFDKGQIIAEGTLSEIRKNTKFNYLWRKYRGEKEKEEE